MISLKIGKHYLEYNPNSDTGLYMKLFYVEDILTPTAYLITGIVEVFNDKLYFHQSQKSYAFTEKDFEYIQEDYSKLFDYIFSDTFTARKLA